MLEVDLRNYLLEQEPLSNLIGARLYPGWIPDNATMPAVAYFNVSNVRHHDIDVAFPRMQFSIFSKRYEEAKQISEELKNVLRRYKGVMGSTSVIQIVHENEYEMYESDTHRYHIAIDFKIIYWE